MSTRHGYEFSYFNITLKEMIARDGELIGNKKGWAAELAFPTVTGWEKVVYDAVMRNGNYLMLPIMKYRSGKHRRWVFQFSKKVFVYVRQNADEKYARIRITHGTGRWLRFRLMRDLLKRSSALKHYAEKCTKIDQCIELSTLYENSKYMKISMKESMNEKGNRFKMLTNNRVVRKRRLKIWDDQYQKGQKKKSFS